MGHIESEREINANIDAVWAIVSDVGTWDKWYSIHAGWDGEPPAEIAQGAKLTEKIMMLGMANKIEWTILELDAPSKIVLSGTGMAEVHVQFTFGLQPTDSGATKLTISGDFDGALIKGALGKAVEKDGVVQLDETLTKLEQLAAAA